QPAARCSERHSARNCLPFPAGAVTAGAFYVTAPGHVSADAATERSRSETQCMTHALAEGGKSQQNLKREVHHGRNSRCGWPTQMCVRAVRVPSFHSGNVLQRLLLGCS